MSDNQRTDDAAPSTVVVTMSAESMSPVRAGLAAELDAAVKPGVKVLVLDMTFTRFCDSQDVSIIAATRRRAGAEDVDLRPVTASPQVQGVLAATALDTVVRVYQRLRMPSALAAATREAGD